jgi:hypothetical protein
MKFNLIYLIKYKKMSGVKDKETMLLGSFGKGISDDVDVAGEENNEDLIELEQSFFKHLPEVILEQNNNGVVEFEPCDRDSQQQGAVVSEDLYKLTMKPRDENFYFNAGTDVLFSGYFGQKNDEDNINGHRESLKNNKRINPFPSIAEERAKQNSGGYGRRLEKSPSAVNCSFLSTRSRNKNSFSDFIKCVSLTSSSSTFNKKKSKVNLTIEILSSEELEIERIKKEKEELRKLKQKNSQMAEKVI